MFPSVVPRGAGAASALLVVLLVGSCGGAGGGDGTLPTISPTGTLPSPTRSLTRSPDATETAEQPSPTAEPTESAEQPSPSRSAEPTESAEQPSPTAEPTETAEQPSPTAEPTEPTESTPESTPEETEEAGEEPAGAAGEEPADDEGVPTWVWWLLAAVAIGSAIAIPFLVAKRRRNAWRLELAAAEGELTWLARELLPGLRHAGSREQVTGGWAVGRERVTAAEDRLTALEATAPDETDREQARSYRDAARQARMQMEQLTGPGPHDTWALDLDEIIANLELVLQQQQRSPA